MHSYENRQIYFTSQLFIATLELNSDEEERELKSMKISCFNSFQLRLLWGNSHDLDEVVQELRVEPICPMQYIKGHSYLNINQKRSVLWFWNSALSYQKKKNVWQNNNSLIHFRTNAFAFRPTIVATKYINCSNLSIVIL